ncbi:MAG: hypothetical protein UT33_C0011G0034 [Candidatus Peregrinibacteria bacterium GW2011_GWC2_39_14]|nr:MAG: hypothetical protein UT33_C0011G0034 [Candidatus Peregrinibacteria bacterium GW2011_GWC2_39_14]
MEAHNKSTPQFQPIDLIREGMSDSDARKANVLKFFSDHDIHFEGSDGSSQEEAIITCGIPNTMLGIMIETMYLQKLGKYPYTKQEIKQVEGRQIESFEAADGTKTWFDVTEWYGKF